MEVVWKNFQYYHSFHFISFPVSLFILVNCFPLYVSFCCDFLICVIGVLWGSYSSRANKPTWNKLIYSLSHWICVYILNCLSNLVDWNRDWLFMCYQPCSLGIIAFKFKYKITANNSYVELAIHAWGRNQSHHENSKTPHVAELKLYRHS